MLVNVSLLHHISYFILILIVASYILYSLILNLSLIRNIYYIFKCTHTPKDINFLFVDSASASIFLRYEDINRQKY